MQMAIYLILNFLPWYVILLLMILVTLIGILWLYTYIMLTIMLIGKILLHILIRHYKIVTDVVHFLHTS